MFNKRQQGGILPQFQSDTLQSSYSVISHDVDLSSNSIRPAHHYDSLTSLDCQKISYDNNRVIYSGSDSDTHARMLDKSFLWSGGKCYVERSSGDYISPNDFYLQIPRVTNFRFDGDTLAPTEVCDDYRAYRIRYISEYGELSDVLAVTGWGRVENQVLRWDVENMPSSGTWLIERCTANYMQVTNHSQVQNEDNYFVIAEIPYVNKIFYDDVPVGEACDTLPTFIDAYHIDELVTDFGVITPNGEMVTAKKDSTIVYISYPNKPYLFPLYNLIDTGSKIKALVVIQKGVLVFHEYGTGVLTLDSQRGELNPTTNYIYNSTSCNISLINPKTISVRDGLIYYMSSLGLVMYPTGMTVNPNPRVVTFDIMADEVSKLDVDTMVGQTFEDGYYLTDGKKSFVISNLDTFFMDSSQPVIRTTSVKSRVVSQYHDGSLMYVDGTDVRLTKFRYEIIDPKSDIDVRIYGYDDRGEVLIYQRLLNHSDVFQIKNGFRYIKYSVELRFGTSSVYKTTINLTSGLTTYGRGRIVRDTTHETLRITEIGLAGRTNQFTNLKGT